MTSTPSETAPTASPLELPIAAARRNADFHTIFPSLKDELLIEDFSCAILRDILIQGRLYLSENHLAFSARLLTWTLDVLIPLNSIMSIDKRFVAGFIPNSIEITTETDKYFFASFLQRDYAYDVLRKAWNGPPPLSMSEGAKESLGELILVESEEQGLELVSDVQETSFISSTLQRMKSFGDSLGRKSDRSGSFNSPSTNVQPVHHPLESEPVEEDTLLNNVLKISANGSVIFAPSSTPCPMAAGHSGMQLIIDETLIMTPENIWKCLFADEAIHEPDGWLRGYHTSCHRTDFKFSHWPLCNSVTYPTVGSVRSFSYVVPMKASIFYQRQTTPCFGSESIQDIVVDGNDICYLKSFCILSEVKTPEVPYGDTFLTKTHVCVFPYQECWKIRVSVQVVFKKPPWTKVIIEKAVIDGMSEFYGPLIRELKSQEIHEINDKPVLDSIIQEVTEADKPNETPVLHRAALFSERDIRFFLQLNVVLFTFACILLLANLYFMLQIRGFFGMAKTEL